MDQKKMKNATVRTKRKHKNAEKSRLSLSNTQIQRNDFSSSSIVMMSSVCNFNPELVVSFSH